MLDQFATLVAQVIAFLQKRFCRAHEHAADALKLAVEGMFLAQWAHAGLDFAGFQLLPLLTCILDQVDQRIGVEITVFGGAQIGQQSPPLLVVRPALPLAQLTEFCLQLTQLGSMLALEGFLCRRAARLQCFIERHMIAVGVVQFAITGARQGLLQQLVQGRTGLLFLCLLVAETVFNRLNAIDKLILQALVSTGDVVKLLPLRTPRFTPRFKCFT